MDVITNMLNDLMATMARLDQENVWNSSSKACRTRRLLTLTGSHLEKAGTLPSGVRYRR